MDTCCGNKIQTAACDRMGWMVKGSAVLYCAERELHETVCVKISMMMGSMAW